MRRLVSALLVVTALTSCATASSKGASTGSSSKASSSPTPSPKTYTTPPATLPVPQTGVTLSTGPAPWPAPVFLSNGSVSAAYVAAAGLPYAEEMLQVHYHAHLDVVINGRHVPVPAYLGWVAKGRSAVGLAPLHTHDASGVIHIENAVPATFLLGQFFIVWGVRLSPTCIGGYCAGNGNELAVFVNGARYTGDPTKIVLRKHEEIAIVFGKAGKLPKPPASYDFPSSV